MKVGTISLIKDMIETLDSREIRRTSVILEASPVVSFGDFESSRIATLGLNPSNKEFYDDHGKELVGSDRRLHTLSSLGLPSWSKANVDTYKSVGKACFNYFKYNPYDRWFKSLDYLISETGVSYYDDLFAACHLDLVPYATSVKWGLLPTKEKGFLLDIGSNYLARTINGSKIEVLILNGKSVVAGFETLCGIKIPSTNVNSWKLRRKTGFVKGASYYAEVDKIGENVLKRNILVVGYNHNIQSSFGVSAGVKNSIKSWIGEWVGVYA